MTYFYIVSLVFFLAAVLEAMAIIKGCKEEMGDYFLLAVQLSVIVGIGYFIYLDS